jgi:hypothetical protein
MIDPALVVFTFAVPLLLCLTIKFGISKGALQEWSAPKRLLLRVKGRAGAGGTALVNRGNIHIIRSVR